MPDRGRGWFRRRSSAQVSAFCRNAEGPRVGGSDAGQGTPVHCCSRFKRRAGLRRWSSTSKTSRGGERPDWPGLIAELAMSPAPIDDEAGGDGSVQLSRRRREVGGRRDSSCGCLGGAPECPSARRPRESKYPGFNCAWAFAFSVAVCCERSSASRSAPNAIPNRPLSEAAARTMKSCGFKAHSRDRPS